MVWRDGIVPDGGPPYGEELTADLLDFGYSVLAQALELRDTNRALELEVPYETSDAFGAAAQAIESAVRRGDARDAGHGRHLVVCAAAYHLAGYAAQSFSLLPQPALDRNLSSIERALALLLRRDLVALRAHIVRWLGDEVNSDDVLARRLADEDDPLDPHEAVYIGLATAYYRALGTGDTSLIFGTTTDHEGSDARTRDCRQRCGLRWKCWRFGEVATLTQHPPYAIFVRTACMCGSHLTVKSFQSDGALCAIPLSLVCLRGSLHTSNFGHRKSTRLEDRWDPSDDLVIALPTSAGKTRIAELCILRSLADVRRVIYVTPLRALSAQSRAGALSNVRAFGNQRHITVWRCGCYWNGH